MLAGALSERGLTCLNTREPSDGPVGVLIRSLLEKQITPLREVYGDEWAERVTLSLLFAADREDHLSRTVSPALSAGAWVVSDRYFHSTCAYQMRDRESLDWIIELHRHSLIPDITFFIDLDPKESLDRIEKRKSAEGKTEGDLFETLDQLKRIRSAYMETITRLRERGDRLEIIDGCPDKDSVHTAILRALTPLLP